MENLLGSRMEPGLENEHSGQRTRVIPKLFTWIFEINFNVILAAIFNSETLVFFIIFNSAYLK